MWGGKQIVFQNMTNLETFNSTRTFDNKLASGYVIELNTNDFNTSASVRNNRLKSTVLNKY